MSESQIRFNDGASYETLMGIWSRLAGDIFLDWLALPPGLRLADVGCGNGAFTARLIARCAPAAVDGIDPSEAQLRFAGNRPDASMARFHHGDAMALPFPDNSFDAATMALVIFFIPNPAKGVAEMARVVRPGGTIAAYAWDIEGGGAPLEPVWVGLRSIGIQPTHPPRPDASRLEVLSDLWAGAGIRAVETRTIHVTRTFADFDEFWNLTALAMLAQVPADIPPGDLERLRIDLRSRLPAGPDGRITYPAHAHAVKGRLPG